MGGSFKLERKTMNLPNNTGRTTPKNNGKTTPQNKLM